jgi:hypothetical protein
MHACELKIEGEMQREFVNLLPIGYSFQLQTAAFTNREGVKDRIGALPGLFGTQRVSN